VQSASAAAHGLLPLGPPPPLHPPTHPHAPPTPQLPRHHRPHPAPQPPAPHCARDAARHPRHPQQPLPRLAAPRVQGHVLGAAAGFLVPPERARDRADVPMVDGAVCGQRCGGGWRGGEGV